MKESLLTWGLCFAKHFPVGSGVKNPPANAGAPGAEVAKISCRRKGQPAPIFLAWKIQGTVAHQAPLSMGLQRVGLHWATHNNHPRSSVRSYPCTTEYKRLQALKSPIAWWNHAEGAPSKFLQVFPREAYLSHGLKEQTKWMPPAQATTLNTR